MKTISQGWVVEPVAGPLPDGFPTSAIPATVPGVIHTDLLRAGLIEPPFDGDNEAAQQWIGDTSWRYTAQFEWHDDGSTRHDLVALGLDTVATLVLNGHEVARTENQHRSYRFDARPFLVEGENTIVVTFAAPVPAASARAREHGELPRVNHHDYNQLRKTASHFGWDWGIDVAGCGLWRPIGIDSWSGVRVAAVRPLVTVTDGVGLLRAHVTIERAGDDGSDSDSDGAGAAAVPVAVTVDGITARGTITADTDEGMVEVRVPAVRRWWPIGHGGQPLYAVTVTAGATTAAAATAGAATAGAATAGAGTWTGRVGFRTVRVDTSPDEAGRPFQLFVNDELILVRGVNWVPDHAFLPEIDRQRYARRLDDAVQANANLIRVWGGGIYESDDFYDRADELGLLVWQDFLFACAAYAEEPHLATEVEAEAREQITRLSPHPSLVIWNGCNENIWGYADWGWPARLAGRTWGDGYYRQLFPALLAELDPTRFYSPGSPFSFGDYLHPNDPRNGTMHIWDVWNQRDYTVYRDYQPRFVSEFGFQGPPAWSTLAAVVHDAPGQPYGHQMLVHQKAHLGNQKLERGATGHLPAPKNIDDWHWTMQLNQAAAIRFGVEHLRSLTPHNTGVILWQLNDDWPVVSWAAVDFDEHRKPLWFALRDAYAPRLATIQPRSSPEALAAAFEGWRPELDQTVLVLVNDTAVAVDGEVEVSRQAFDGTVLAGVGLKAAVPARGTASVVIPSAVATWGDPRAELIVATLPGFATAIHNGAEVVDQALVVDALDATAQRSPTGYTVTVTARSYVRDVFLQVDRVDPLATVDRGLVTLLAGQSARFTITSAVVVDPSAFLSALVLRTANGLLA